MKKSLKLVISFVLCLAMVLSFVSCGIINVIEDACFYVTNISRKKYKGVTAYDVLRVRWIETYEEAVTIVEKMRLNGETIPSIPAFDCEEYGIDVKFLILFDSEYEKDLEEGKEIYDIPILSVTCYIFLEDITVNKLKMYHNYPHGMDGYYTGTRDNFEIKTPKKTDYVKFSKNVERFNIESTSYGITYNGEYQFSLYGTDVGIELTDEQIKILKKTIVVI